MVDEELRIEIQKKIREPQGSSVYILLVLLALGPVNKVDGRLNRLLVHATSALQNGIQKVRSEGRPSAATPD